jgi:hypothetical protein
LRQPDRAQRLGQIVLVEFVKTGEIDRANGRTLHHLHDHDIAFDGDFHVIEEAGGVQRANRFGGLVVGENIAFPDGQIREYGARFDALQPLDTDISHHERRGCVGHQSMRS